MKKIISFSIMLVLLQSCIGTGQNSKISAIDQAFVKTKKATKEVFFPIVAGIDLQGKDRQFPQAFAGKINLVAVAFMREQQSDVDSWLPTFLQMAKQNSQIQFYELPIINERNAFSRFTINNGMRRGVKDEMARSRTITVYTNRDKFFSLTDTCEENITILIIDGAGKILSRINGPATPEKIQKLRLKLQQLN